MWLLTLFIVVSTFFVWFTALPLARNLAVARKIGLPIVIVPVDPLGLFWLLIGMQFRPLMRRILPESLTDWMHCCVYGGDIEQRRPIHARLGPVFIAVNPGFIELVVGDAVAADQVFTRRKDFPKPARAYRPLEVFGPSVLTTNGDDWQRHRKLTAPCFNERTSNVVWDIATKQAQVMAKSYLSAADGIANSLQRDLRRLALHVLMGVGFGVEAKTDSKEEIEPGYVMSFPEALRTVLAHIVYAFAASPKVLTAKIMPKTLRKLGYALEDFVKYNHTMLEDETRRVESDEAQRNNLLSVMLRASKQEASTAGRKSYLSDEEVIGNMFIFNLAGHDTASNTMESLIGLVALYPEWQDWMREEILHVRSSGNITYDSFSKLKRCQAVMVSILIFVLHVLQSSNAYEV